MKKIMPRELTATERREIRRLVRRCSYFDRQYGCWLFEDVCYMQDKIWTGGLCVHFKNAVLPENPVLERALKREPPANTKPCAVCGKPFSLAGRKAYCSDKCRETGQKALDAKRAKKYRQNKGRAVTN